jgi:hypothetical protein
MLRPAADCRCREAREGREGREAREARDEPITTVLLDATPPTTRSERMARGASSAKF